MLDPQRYLILVNPRSGMRRGLTVLEQVRPILESRGAELDVRVTQTPGHAADLARSCQLSDYHSMCVIGGDGTVHEVADGLMQRGEPIGTPLGIIPAGTGNTLHQHLQLHDPREAARRIIEGRSQSLDVARVRMGERTVFCIDIVGWGAVADINRSAERLRSIGASRYAVASLWHLLWKKPRRAVLTFDDTTIEDDFLFVIACNARFTGSGMQLAPLAETGDGKIDLVFVRRATRRQLLTLFAKVYNGSHVALSYVEYHQVRSFQIETACTDPLDLDGEIKGTAPFTVEVLPAALRILA